MSIAKGSSRGRIKAVADATWGYRREADKPLRQQAIDILGWIKYLPEQLRDDIRMIFGFLDEGYFDNAEVVLKSKLFDMLDNNTSNIDIKTILLRDSLIEDLFNITQKVRSGEPYFSTVENCETTAHSQLVLDQQQTGDAEFKQKVAEAVRGLASLIEDRGFDAFKKEIVEVASLDDRLRKVGMDVAACFKTAAETTRPAPPPKLSKAALAAFKAHAAAHQWNPESKIKVAPSDFIKETFKKWLKRGLPLTDVKDAQQNLAEAYSKEISRDPSRRVKGLYVRLHKLPAGTPRQVVVVRRVRHVADLSEEQAAKKRAGDAARKQRQRLRQRASTVSRVTHTP